MSALNERIEAAAEHFGVKPEDITGASRFKVVVLARQHIMRELRLGGWSLGQIGLAFNRHHTSVLHLTRGYEPPAPERVVRALPMQNTPAAKSPKPPVAREPYVRGTDREAEVHHRRYMKNYRRNCIVGSTVLRERCLALLARRQAAGS